MQIPEIFDNKKVRVFSVVILILLVVLGAAFAIFGPKKPKEQTGQILSKTAKSVEEFIVGQKDTTTLEYLGIVDSDTALDLTAQTAGVIISIDVEAGQTLARGTQIATLGTAIGQVHQTTLGIQTAQQQLDSAKNQLARIKTSSDLLIKQADFGITSSEDAAKLASQQKDLAQLSIDSLNSTIFDLKNQLVQLQSIPSPTPEQIVQIESLNSAILQAEIQKNQLESGKNQLEAAAKDNNPQTETSKRTLDLVKSQALASIDAAESQVKLSEIGLVSANLIAETSKIKMPFTARLDKIFVDVGQTVTPGTPIAKILGNSQFKILIQVPANISSKVATSQKAQILLDDLQITGTIRRVSQVAEKTSKLFEVEIIPDQNVFQVGQQVSVHLPIRLEVTAENFQKQIPLTVPLDSLYVAGDNRYLFVNENSRAIKKNIKVAEIIGNQIVVTEGIKSGDKVIVARGVIEGEEIIAKTN